jgi:hypothetical protein
MLTGTQPFFVRGFEGREFHQEGAMFSPIGLSVAIIGFY